MRVSSRHGAGGALALLVGLWVASCAGGTQMTDQGLVTRPKPVGDLTEISIEQALRNSTGIWMGAKRGVALEELQERVESEFSRTPTSGGITSLRFGKGVYFSLYSYELPNDLSTILVCGYSVWTSMGTPLPSVVRPDRVRAALSNDARTQRVGDALYRRTSQRAISLLEGDEENAFFYVDITKCPSRDPGPPDEDA